MMKHCTWVIGATLALSNAMTFAQTTAHGDSSTQSQTSFSAWQGGASANHGSSGAARLDAGKSNAELAGGSQVNATLSRPVDAGRSKPGDEVTATAAEDVKSNGHVVIPKGSKLVGRVTSAKRRGDTSQASSAPAANGADSASTAASATGEAASHLGIIFDKALLKDGREVPLSAGIQALAAGEGAVSGQMDDVGGSMYGAGSMAGSARGTGGGLVGGATGAVGGAVRGTANAGGSLGGTVGSAVGAAGVVSRSPGAVGGLNGAGRLTSDSRGVFGMKGLELTSASTASAQGSLITSSTRNVRLDRGTRMLLLTSGDATGSTIAPEGTRGVSGSANAAGNLSGAASTAGKSGNTGEASGVTGVASGAARAGAGVDRASTAPREGAESTSAPAGDQSTPR